MVEWQLASFDRFTINVSFFKEHAFKNILNSFSPRRMKFSGCKFLEKTNESEYRHRMPYLASFDHFIIDLGLITLNNF